MGMGDAVSRASDHKVVARGFLGSGFLFLTVGGLLALLRNEGGSVGTSLAQTLQERREQFHILRLNEGLDVLNPLVSQTLARAEPFFLKLTGDAPLSRLMSLQSLANLRNQQASSLAYFDVFWASALISALLVFLVLLMRRSVAEKGAHLAAE